MKGNASPLKERKLKDEGCKKKRGDRRWSKVAIFVGNKSPGKTRLTQFPGLIRWRWPPNTASKRFMYRLFLPLSYPFLFFSIFFPGSARSIDGYNLSQVIQEGREMNSMKLNARYIFSLFVFFIKNNKMHRLIYKRKKKKFENSI